MSDRPDYKALLAIDAAFTQEMAARVKTRQLLCADDSCWAAYTFEVGSGLRPYMEARQLGWRNRGTTQGHDWFCPEHPPPAIVKH